MRYLEANVQKQSELQSNRAKANRRGSYDSITKLINEIVDGEPKMTALEVLDELKRTDGIVILDDEIRNNQDAQTMKVSNLASRVSDAKKRFSG